VGVGVGAALAKALQGIGGAVQAQGFDAGHAFFEPLGLHRALERRQGLALEIGDLLDTAVLAHQHVAGAPAVGLGEGDHAFALGGDAQGGDQHVDLAPEQLRHAVLRGHAGEGDLVARAEGPFGDLPGHFHLDAGEIAVVVLVAVGRLVAAHAGAQHVLLADVGRHGRNVLRGHGMRGETERCGGEQGER